MKTCRLFLFKDNQHYLTPGFCFCSASGETGTDDENHRQVVTKVTHPADEYVEF
jgi:hypothetical protein